MPTYLGQCVKGYILESAESPQRHSLSPGGSPFSLNRACHGCHFTPVEGSLTHFPPYCQEDMVNIYGTLPAERGIVEKTMESLADLLKDLRHQRGLSQDAAGRLAGVSGAHLSRVEAGRVPSARVLRDLARVYEVPVEQLLQRAGYLPAVADSDATMYLTDAEARRINSAFLYCVEAGYMPHDTADRLHPENLLARDQIKGRLAAVQDAEQEFGLRLGIEKHRDAS